jgi:hypothetical protein
MRYFFYPIASLLFAIAPVAALHATTIDQTFSFVNMSTYGSENGSNVADFNPALGTLNSVSYSFTVTSTLNLPVVNNQAKGYYFFELGPVNGEQDINGQPLTFSGTLTSASFGFAAFTGNGSLTPFINVEPYPGLDPGNGYSSTFSLGTVTYNYTRSTASAAPETSSFSLLAAGLAAVGLLRRRSRLASSENALANAYVNYQRAYIDYQKSTETLFSGFGMIVSLPKTQ